MVELKLKAHRPATIFECCCYIVLLSLICFVLYLRFCTNWLYKDGFDKSDYLDSFLYHYPYYFLAFALLIMAGLCCMLKKCLVYLYKGYVVAINSEGMRLPNDYFIAWRDIEHMDIITTGVRFNKITFIQVAVKPKVTKNFIDHIKKMYHSSIMLSNFQQPKEAYNQLCEFWNKYH